MTGVKGWFSANQLGGATVEARALATDHLFLSQGTSTRPTYRLSTGLSTVLFTGPSTLVRSWWTTGPCPDQDLCTSPL